MNIDHRKLHRQLRKKSSDRVAADLREKEKKDNYKQFDKRDSYLFDKGIEWFESGLSLDDAHDDMKNNTNFVNGFNKAKRLNDINNMLYNDGKEFFRASAFADGYQTSGARFQKSYQNNRRNDRKG